MCGWSVDRTHKVPLPAFYLLRKKRAGYTLGRKINTEIKLCLQPGGLPFDQHAEVG